MSGKVANFASVMEKLKDDLYLATLRREVEIAAGLKEKTSRTFEILSEKIQESGAGYISASSLKRLWGYVKDSGKKNDSTLDVLARFVGCDKGYAAFKEKFDSDNGVESGYDSKRVLNVVKLLPNSRIEVKWFPDRCVVLRYEGSLVFEVEISINSKLKEGTRVLCARIAEGEPLLLDIPDEDGRLRLVYRGGEINGVVWKIL